MNTNSMVWEKLDEGIVVTDEKGFIAYANPAFAKMVGYGGEQLLSKEFIKLFKFYDLNGQPLGNPTEYEEGAKLQIEGAGGARVAVTIKMVKLTDTNEMVLVLHDFSEDLRLQKQRDEFFLIASHELQTPLTVIAGNLDMIAGGMGGSKLTENDMKMLTDSLEATYRLVRMVAGFLNIARLDQGRVKVETKIVDMCDMARVIKSDMDNMAADKGLEIKLSCPPNKIFVKADPDKIKEVFTNLIGNSIKFTKEGQVEVELKQNGEMLECRVKDTGIGIASDQQSLLFHKFQQAMGNTMNREASGTGLGLYISREFVKLMGGSMMLESSELGKGSTFIFTLPILKEK